MALTAAHLSLTATWCGAASIGKPAARATSATGAPARAGEVKLFMGPFLQRPGTKTMTVMWIADQSVESELRWGKGKAEEKTMKVKPRNEVVLGDRKATEPKAYTYAAVLNDLEPGTEYGYEVSCGGGKGSGSFRTFEEKPKSLVFIAYGDSRSGKKMHTKIAARFAAHKPAFIIHTGDMIHGGRYGQWASVFFEPLAGVINNIPLVPVRGNHEGAYQRFSKIFGLAGDKSYNSLDCGDVHLTCLDSGVEGMSSEREYARQQLAWSEKDISSSKARWKIASYHRPSFDLGHHHSKFLRKSHLPLFRKYGLDITITAHSHSYQRFKPMYKSGDNDKHPITHIISAGGGAPVEGFKDDPHLALGANAYHYMVFTVEGNTLSAKTFDPDGKVLDSFSIEKKDDGSFTAEYLKEAMREGDFGQFSECFSYKKIYLTTVPTAEKAADLKLNLNAGSMAAKYEVRVAARSAGSYLVEPLSGTIEAGKSAEVIARIKAKGAASTGKRGRLEPRLILECSYEIAGKKGKLTTSPLSVRAR